MGGAAAAATGTGKSNVSSTDKGNADESVAQSKEDEDREKDEEKGKAAFQPSSARVPPTGWSAATAAGASTFDTAGEPVGPSQSPGPSLPVLSTSPIAVDKVLELSAPKHSPLSPSRAKNLEKKKASGNDADSLSEPQGEVSGMPPSYATATASSQTKEGSHETSAQPPKDDDRGGRFIDANATVLQSLSRPVSDYRQSLQDLQAAMDRVLTMYEEANTAHSRLSQSFASFLPPANAPGGATEELNAVTGVLSDLRTGIVQANQRLSSVIPLGSAAAAVAAATAASSQDTDESAMRKRYAELAEQLEKE